MSYKTQVFLRVTNIDHYHSVAELDKDIFTERPNIIIKTLCSVQKKKVNISALWTHVAQARLMLISVKPLVSFEV